MNSVYFPHLSFVILMCRQKLARKVRNLDRQRRSRINGLEKEHLANLSSRLVPCSCLVLMSLGGFNPRCDQGAITWSWEDRNTSRCFDWIVKKKTHWEEEDLLLLCWERRWFHSWYQTTGNWYHCWNAADVTLLILATIDSQWCLENCDFQTV